MYSNYAGPVTNKYRVLPRKTTENFLRNAVPSENLLLCLNCVSFMVSGQPSPRRVRYGTALFFAFIPCRGTSFREISFPVFFGGKLLFGVFLFREFLFRGFFWGKLLFGFFFRDFLIRDFLSGKFAGDKAVEDISVKMRPDLFEILLTPDGPCSAFPTEKRAPQTPGKISLILMIISYKVGSCHEICDQKLKEEPGRQFGGSAEFFLMDKTV